MIDTNIMINFLGTYANEEISKDRYGNKTTVLVEFSEICKDSGKYICMLAEYYTKQGMENHSDAFSSADDYEKLQEKMELKLYYLIKKALWLNNRCKTMTGQPFLTRRLDQNSVRDCAKFVKKLYRSLRNYLETVVTDEEEEPSERCA